MPKNQIDSVSGEIKKLLKSKRLIIGTQRTLKGLKEGKLQRVYVSSNCPASVRQDIAHYTRIHPVEIVELEQPNEDVGGLCKKPFLISVLGLLKEGTA